MKSPTPWRLCVVAAPLVAATLALMGCASTPPSSFYALSPLSATGGTALTAGGELALGLGPVSFPAFLDRPQIVVQTSGNRLTIDEFHRWGGTLQDDFLRVWSENLACLLGTGRILILPSEMRYPLELRIVADVLAFQGTPDGQALLKVRWAVIDPHLEQVLTMREDSYRRPVAKPGDKSALIAALSATLADFSQTVATLVRSLPRTEAPAQSAVAAH